MEKICIDFTGYITVDKKDLVINTIDDEGKFNKVDVSKLTTQEILDGYSKGYYYVDLWANDKVALDGSSNYEMEVDND